jgi:hypothetical protein
MRIAFFVQGRIRERIHADMIPRVGEAVWLPEGYFIVTRVAHDLRREDMQMVNIWLTEEL